MLCVPGSTLAFFCTRSISGLLMSMATLALLLLREAGSLQAPEPEPVLRNSQFCA